MQSTSVLTACGATTAKHPMEPCPTCVPNAAATSLRQYLQGAAPRERQKYDFTKPCQVCDRGRSRKSIACNAEVSPSLLLLGTIAREHNNAAVTVYRLEHGLDEQRPLLLFKSFAKSEPDIARPAVWSSSISLHPTIAWNIFASTSRDSGLLTLKHP